MKSVFLIYMRLSLKTIAFGTVTKQPTHMLPRLFAEMFQSWCTFHSAINCERHLKAHRQCHAAMPSGPAARQDINHILGASVHGIMNSFAQRPQVPSGVIILHGAMNICRVGAEVAPPRVLAKVVESQRIDG